YNSLVVVPNALLVRATVDNYGQRQYRRYKTHLALTYDTPPDRIDAFCEGVRELIRAHPYTRKDYYHVYLHQMGASSLDILIYMFHDCPDWSVELRERHRLLTDILRLAAHLEVSFAFPTQTLHLERGTDEPLPALDGDPLTVGRGAARIVTADAPWTHTRPGPVLFPGGGDDHE
ncbi:MAG: mechanosensitive ion channel, partial [Phycisphaerales bacterium]|nr:mechanosensitive ion channel [Phycisphaerales bacterium]